ncbi:carbohydrate-binding family 9-like protein [Polaribacter sp. IC073]|uniref:carbohydrate-binding family 9-like protein n=1 Tax=Polaribacter sp. IC073 TaxID=2508540 RepID=UPI0011BDF205|nr:carbohydrate-binding family 9-like protein [Polaribacter sp. IC073]TXD46370.1 carbohydrate-binding family 9-like protein [Polaribacter sp. IC073]
MILNFQYLSILCCFLTTITTAQSKVEITPENYIAYHTSEAILIDGNEKDVSWDKVAWSAPFIDIQGVKKPTYKTQIKMLWDDTYFYILAKMEEPHVWADITERDAIIFHNNDFEVFIDPDGDTHNYYEIEVNAINTIWDLFITKPYRELNNVALNDWTATGMKSAITIDGTLNNPNDTDKGWILEMAIPWSVYKKSYFEKNVPKDEFWRVNFSRVNWDYQITDGKYERKKDANEKHLPEYNWVWSPQGVINMHEPEKWGYVYFSSKEVGKKDTFEIPNEEKIKWELYQLYRTQKKYFTVNKSWATTIEKLTLSPIIIDGKKINPKLENHRFGWTIFVDSPFSNKTLIIKEDGKLITH